VRHALFGLKIKRRTLGEGFEKLGVLAINQVDSDKHQDPADHLINAQVFTK
jgi:hypothetical protein